MDRQIQISLISEKLFKLHSPITSNTDITEFIPYICIAQELHILPILGEEFSAELCDQVSTNSLTPENSDLILKIAAPLSFYSVYQALPFHWATIVNKGITIRESENSKGIDIADLSQLRRWIKDDADMLRDNLVRFLTKCKANYPLWVGMEECAKDSSYGYDSGFHFPGASERQVRRLM